MSVLLSFSNLTDRSQPPLGLLDLESFTLSIPPIPDELRGSLGITGLAASQDAIYVVVQRPAHETAEPDTSALAILAPGTLSLKGFYTFSLGLDVHSIMVVGDRLLAVSTGTDELLELGLADAGVTSESVVWRPRSDAPRTDINHLNGLCSHRGALIVSGFGPRSGDRWSSATKGYILNLDCGDVVRSDLRQPHSVASCGSEVAYCESAQAAVTLGDFGRVSDLPGYTRGLCLVDRQWLVGTSVGRHPEDSRGIANAADPGICTGMCGVSSIGPGLQVERSLDLGAYATEIYDLLPLWG